MTRRRILVVEDEWIVARDLQRTLENLGFDVVRVVASGEQAVEFAATDRPDLVLMDIILQGTMDGVTAAEEIWGQLGIPTVYLTAHSDAAVVASAAGAEPFGYLTKPFKDADLAASIEIALHRHLLDRERRAREARMEVALSERAAALEQIEHRLAAEIVDRTRAEQAAVAASLTQDRLLAEIRDRVVNNLQAIYGLFALEPGSGGDDSRDLCRVSQSRVMTIALVYRYTQVRRGEWVVDMQQYLTALAPALSHSYRRDAQICLQVVAEPIVIPVSCAISCGLFVHELLREAIAHAAEPRVGSLQVRLGVGDSLELSVESDGLPMEQAVGAQEPEQSVLGLARSLAEDQLGGDCEITITSSALRACVRFGVPSGPGSTG